MLPVETDPAATALPLHVVPAGELSAFLRDCSPEAAAFLQAGGFTAGSGELRLIPGPGGLAGAVLGLGAAADPAAPWPYGGLAFALPEDSLWHLADAGRQDGAALGWCLGAYRFDRYRKPGRRPARLQLSGECQPVLATARAVWRVRDLINTPAADLGPQELAAAVTALGLAHGAEVELVEGAALAEGFPAIAAVGQGSHRPPCVALLRWGRPEDPLVALCGKGVVFDTGGLDLKSAEGMRRMKKDMGGAAMLIGLAELIMARGTPLQLLLAVGCVENAVSDRALRPSDVIATRAGISVEIGNTDAEGRLVLADLLRYAAEKTPYCIIDAATLTGAARTALGPDLPALFCNDHAFAEALLAAGRQVVDPLWRLPLHDGYASWLDSSVADINNVASRPMAGAVVAALFLQKFVPENLRWAHLDLYAWNDAARPGRPEGGEAQAMRALHAALEKLLSGEKDSGAVSKPAERRIK